MVQFHSTDDPLVPFREGKFVAAQLGLTQGTDFIVFGKKGHLWDFFPELISCVTDRLPAASSPPDAAAAVDGDDED